MYYSVNTSNYIAADVSTHKNLMHQGTQYAMVYKDQKTKYHTYANGRSYCTDIYNLLWYAHIKSLNTICRHACNAIQLCYILSTSVVYII